MSELYSEKQVKARKRHICHLCGRGILPGNEYIKAKWFDAGFHEVDRHIHCDALLNVVAPELSNDGEIWEDEVTELLRGTCADLHNRGVCTDEDYEECGDSDCYSCYLVQSEWIKSPVILRAAEQSVKDNDE